MINATQRFHAAAGVAQQVQHTCCPWPVKIPEGLSRQHEKSQAPCTLTAFDPGSCRPDCKSSVLKLVCRAVQDQGPQVGRDQHTGKSRMVSAMASSRREFVGHLKDGWYRGRWKMMGTVNSSNMVSQVAVSRLFR